MNSSDVLKLAATIFFAVTCVTIGDTAGKLMTSNGVDPVLVAWCRFALAAAVLLPLSGLKVSELHTFKDWRILLRGLFITGGIVCILTALKTEPIANVFGAFFIGPVVAYILAILFLGEKPTATRSALLGLGVIGVILVVKPGVGVSTGMLFALAAGTSYGSYLVMTRTVAGHYRPRLLLISQLLLGTLLLTPMGLSVTLPPIDANLVMLMCISALASAAGNYLLVIASKTAEASLIAPLIYTQLISATVLGILVFGDWPDLYSMVGLILIAASGIGSLVFNRPKIT